MSTHLHWLEQIKTYKEAFRAKYQRDIELPPPTLEELKLEYLEVEPGKRMVARLPFQSRFTNPLGLYQGGFLSAAVDEVLGPLSYITAGSPCMTLSLNMTYVKAFTPELKFLLIEGEVLKKTQGLIFLKATVKTETGDLIAHAESHVLIARDEQLARKS